MKRKFHVQYAHKFQRFIIIFNYYSQFVTTLQQVKHLIDLIKIFSLKTSTLFGLPNDFFTLPLFHGILEPRQSVIHLSTVFRQAFITTPIPSSSTLYSFCLICLPFLTYLFFYLSVIYMFGQARQIYKKDNIK